MSDVPERIWVENLNANWMKWPNASLEKPTHVHNTQIEYIRKAVADKQLQDATKNVRALYETYSYACDIFSDCTEIRNAKDQVIYDLWQAIEADGKTAGWAKE